jgi:rubrerythrin
MSDFDDFLAFIIVLIGAAAVITIIDQATNKTKYECPNCHAILSRGMSPCPNCKTPIRWY